jgi:myo-inositol-1(or 4)-monophosphatase
MHPLLNIAIRAARAAGNVIVRHVDRVDALTVTAKGLNDFVSEVDRDAERQIVNIIHKAYPGHAILAEESGSSGQGPFRWIIDPLDGTTNYLHGFPQVAVSIAVEHLGRIEQGVIFDPLRQEMFTASRGEGARLEDKRLRVSGRGSLKGALLGTGIPFRDQGDLDPYLATLRELVPGTAGIRRAGAAALDLAYVASGRLDGFWEFGLKPWDMAAGILLIREAGGIVTDTDGGEDFMATGNVAAGSPRVLQGMVAALRRARTTGAGPSVAASGSS